MKNFFRKKENAEETNRSIYTHTLQITSKKACSIESGAVVEAIKCIRVVIKRNSLDHQAVSLNDPMNVVERMLCKTEQKHTEA